MRLALTNLAKNVSDILKFIIINENEMNLKLFLFRKVERRFNGLRRKMMKKHLGGGGGVAF